ELAAAGRDPTAFTAAERDQAPGAAAGRDPAGVAAGRGTSAFDLTWGGLAVLGANPEEARTKSNRLGGDRPGVVRGTASEVAEQLAAYAAAGAAWVILGPVDS